MGRIRRARQTHAERKRVRVARVQPVVPAGFLRAAPAQFHRAPARVSEYTGAGARPIPETDRCPPRRKPR